MSPKVFSVTTTSIDSGAFTIVIANESTSAWSSGTSGYSARAELGDDVAPEARGVQDVDLVDRGQAPAPLARDLERAARDPLDLGPRVLARVEPRPVVAGALRAEVEPADELAHDHEVDPSGARRPEVRVDAELLAQAEQPLLGTHRLAPRARAGRPRRAARRRPRGRPRASRRAAACPARGSRCRRRRARCARSRARRGPGSPRPATSGPIPSPGRTATSRHASAVCAAS